MQISDVEKLRAKNAKLRTIIWEHYRIFKQDLLQLQTDNENLRNQIFEEKQRRADIVELYSRKISLLETELRNIRSYSQKPSQRQKINIRDPRWKFDELEEEGKYLFQEAESIFERSQDPKKLLKKAQEKIASSQKKKPVRLDTDDSSSSCSHVFEKFDTLTLSEDETGKYEFTNNQTSNINTKKDIDQNENSYSDHYTQQNYEQINNDNDNSSLFIKSKNKTEKITKKSSNDDHITIDVDVSSNSYSFKFDFKEEEEVSKSNEFIMPQKIQNEKQKQNSISIEKASEEDEDDEIFQFSQSDRIDKLSSSASPQISNNKNVKNVSARKETNSQEVFNKSNDIVSNSGQISDGSYELVSKADKVSIKSNDVSVKSDKSSSKSIFSNNNSTKSGKENSKLNDISDKASSKSTFSADKSDKSSNEPNKININFDKKSSQLINMNSKSDETINNKSDDTSIEPGEIVSKSDDMNSRSAESGQRSNDNDNDSEVISELFSSADEIQMDLQKHPQKLAKSDNADENIQNSIEEDISTGEMTNYFKLTNTDEKDTNSNTQKSMEKKDDELEIEEEEINDNDEIIDQNQNEKSAKTNANENDNPEKKKVDNKSAHSSSGSDFELSDLQIKSVDSFYEDYIKKSSKPNNTAKNEPHPSLKNESTNLKQSEGSIHTVDSSINNIDNIDYQSQSENEIKPNLNLSPVAISPRADSLSIGEESSDDGFFGRFNDSDIVNSNHS